MKEGIPFISVEAIVNNKIDFKRKRGYISNEYNEKCNQKYKPQKNDVYLVKSGSTVGKTAIVETNIPFNIWSPLAALRPNNKTSPYFLFYLLQTDNLQSQVINKSKGGTQPNLSMRLLEHFKIFVPNNIDCQTKIARLLIKVDKVISLQQRKQKLNTILRHNLLNTLISYDKVNNQCRIKTFVKVISKTINPQNFPNDKFQEYSMPAFDKNKKPDIVLGNTMHSNKFKISQPTILFNKLNVRKNRIWNITESQNNDICSTEFIPLTTKSINQNYLYFALQTDYILYHVISLSTGSSNSQKRITPNDLLNLTIPIPSQEKQEEISHILNALDKKIHGNNIKIKQLKKLKKFMLEKLFI